MESPIIYYWNMYTYLYIGSKPARMNPLDLDKYLLPKYSTFEKPPDPKESYVIIRRDNKWIEIHQDEYNKKEEKEIIPAIDLLRVERNLKLQDVDWIVIKYVSLNKKIPKEISNYMQYLRDLPEKSNPKLNSDGTLDQNSVDWPKVPDITQHKFRK